MKFHKNSNISQVPKFQTLAQFHCLKQLRKKKSFKLSVSKAKPPLQTLFKKRRRSRMGLGNRSRWTSFGKLLLGDAFSIFKFLCFLHVTDNYLVSHVFAYGPSMIPTINPSGELLFSERISPKMGKVHPGDIVIVRSPLVPKRLLTKRLIAMEGERVAYVLDPKNSDTRNTIVVPKGHVWVEGDNIYESMDSRYFGAIPYGLITGRVFWRVFPFKDFGSMGPREK